MKRHKINWRVPKRGGTDGIGQEKCCFIRIKGHLVPTRQLIKDSGTD